MIYFRSLTFSTLRNTENVIIIVMFLSSTSISPLSPPLISKPNFTLIWKSQDRIFICNIVGSTVHQLLYAGLWIFTESATRNRYTLCSSCSVSESRPLILTRSYLMPIRCPSKNYKVSKAKEGIRFSISSISDFIQTPWTSLYISFPKEPPFLMSILNSGWRRNSILEIWKFLVKFLGVTCWGIIYIEAVS